MSSAADEAIELAESAGLVLDPWQRLVMADALGERSDGVWAALEVGLIVPRQNGKGSVIEARELAGLFLFDEKLILHSAHELKTSLEAFRRILYLIESTPDLDGKVKRVSRTNGDEGVELKSGARLKFVARSKGSGRGFSGDLVVLDESYDLSRKAISALMPTMSARDNPQLWYTSTAPLDGPESDVLRKLMRRGRAGGSSRLCYLEWCADDDAQNDDRDAWRAANPGRVDPEFIEAELDAMDPEDFARERLGIVNLDPSKGAWAVIDKRDWSACNSPTLELDDPLCLAVDVTPERDRASIGASDGAGVELVEARDGTSWVVDRLVELHGSHGVRAVAVDNASPAAPFIEDLEARDVPVVQVDTKAAKAAVAQMVDGIAARSVAHLDQPALTAAAAGATKRPVGDTWLWNRRAGVDITPLVACTLARWAANLPVEQEPEMAPPEVIVL